MARALELARRGTALASPNPMVGAVLVRDNRVIGEGFHTYDGKTHAEVLALQAAGDAARHSTLYINLEPCCHTGRTPPCTRALIRAGIRRVVAATRDPNPAVAGKGLRELRRAGIEVTLGVMEEPARRLNEAFTRWITSGMPLVTLKAAMSLDGRIAPPARLRDEKSRWITSEASRAEVQQMRHASDAVLTGIGTVLADDPLLTDRTGQPRRRRLLRVILDSKLRLPLNSRIVKTAQGDVLVFTKCGLDSPRAHALRRAGIELVRICGPARRPDLRAVLAELGQCEILSVLMEAGSQINGAALAAGVVDKLALFVAPKMLGSDALPFAAAAGQTLRRMPPCRNLSLRQLGCDFLVEGYLRDVYGNH